MDDDETARNATALADVPGAPVLRIAELSKTFPGQRALDRASLELRPGEIHALVGQNGSGKSTLIKILAGYVRGDPGARVVFDGRRVDLWHLAGEQRERIRVVHQDLGLVPSLSAVENLGLGRGYITGLGGRIRWRAETRRAQALLLRFGVAPDVRRPVGTLGAAERTAVAIMRALQDVDDARPHLLVLDEPTASLNRSEVDALFREVRSFAARGHGVVFVTHILEEVLELADRVTVLRDARVVASGVPVRELDAASLIELIVGRAVGDLFPGGAPRRGSTVLKAEAVVGLTLRGVSVRVHAGETLGVAGLVGSGRDELCGALFGATPRFAGRVLVEGRKVFASPRDSMRAGMALVPADRKALGLVARDRLVQHVTLPRLGPVERGIVLDHRREDRDVRRWVERVEIEPPLLRRRMEKFSGGNQQKAVLARWLRTEPRVLLLDEPTQGVDVGAKAAIYRLVADTAASGAAIVVASSDAEELAHLCDRVVVLRGGAIAAELEGPSLTEERIVAETLGATSQRGVMRVARRPVAMRVIRSDADLPAGEAGAAPAGRTAPPPVPRRLRDRLGALWARVRRRRR